MHKRTVGASESPGARSVSISHGSPGTTINVLGTGCSTCATPEGDAGPTT